MFEDYDENENIQDKGGIHDGQPPKINNDNKRDPINTILSVVGGFLILLLIDNWKKILKFFFNAFESDNKKTQTNESIIDAVFHEVDVDIVLPYLPPPQNIGIIKELRSIHKSGDKLKLKVFLSHSSKDKQAVTNLSKRLACHGVDVWLDSEKLLPGQRWETEIELAIEKSSAVIVCLSQNSVNKEGFLQKEIKKALEVEKLKPPETIYLIPAKLGDCDIPFDLRARQCVDLFSDDGFEKLLVSLNVRALGLDVSPPQATIAIDQSESSTLLNLIDLQTRHKVKASVLISNEYQVVNNALELASKSVIDDALKIAVLLKNKEIKDHKFEDHADKTLGNEKHTIYILKDNWLGVNLVIICRSRENLNEVKNGIKKLIQERYGLSYYKI